MIIVLLADGFEEIEAIGTVDILRRAHLEVFLVSINQTEIVKSARNVKIIADKTIDSVDWSLVQLLVLPGGGEGVENLGKSEYVRNLIIYLNDLGKHIAAICAAPTLLSELGIIKNKKATCYPGLKLNCAEHLSDHVVIDGNIITSRGAGTTHLFATAIIDLLIDKKVSDEILLKMVYELS